MPRCFVSTTTSQSLVYFPFFRHLPSYTQYRMPFTEMHRGLSKTNPKYPPPFKTLHEDLKRLDQTSAATFFAGCETSLVASTETRASQGPLWEARKEVWQLKYKQMPVAYLSLRVLVEEHPTKSFQGLIYGLNYPLELEKNNIYAKGAAQKMVRDLMVDHHYTSLMVAADGARVADLRFQSESEDSFKLPSDWWTCLAPGQLGLKAFQEIVRGNDKVRVVAIAQAKYIKIAQGP